MQGSITPWDIQDELNQQLMHKLEIRNSNVLFIFILFVSGSILGQGVVSYSE